MISSRVLSYSPIQNFLLLVKKKNAPHWIQVVYPKQKWVQLLRGVLYYAHGGKLKLYNIFEFSKMSMYGARRADYQRFPCKQAEAGPSRIHW